MTSATSIATAPRQNSPVLRAFELNPFRVLRLQSNVSTADAANEAQSVLTLDRVGLPPDNPDPLPWLPRPGSYDLQQAAQAIEEPLVRLRYQLLWFDLTRDADRELLQTALAEPWSETCRQYLSSPVKLPYVEELPSIGDSPTVRAEIVSTAVPETDAVEPPVVDVGITPARVTGETKGHDVSCELNLGFWDAIRGGTKTVVKTHRVRCGDCQGTGNSPTSTTVCPSCQGLPKKLKSCFRCDQSGKLSMACVGCRGEGWNGTPIEINVRVPSGVETGTKLRLTGEGEVGREGEPSGDLYVHVKVDPHQTLHRSGNDIWVQVALLTTEAINGLELELPTLDRTVTIRIPKGIERAQTLRLREKGIWNSITGHRGDFYAEIAIPTSSGRAREQRQELAEACKQVAASMANSGESSPLPAAGQPKPSTRCSIPPDLALIAHAVNRANLLLMSEAAAVDQPVSPRSDAGQPATKINPNKWKTHGKLAVLSAPHTLLENGAKVGDFGPNNWAGALHDWTTILGHPWFRCYVEACIAELGDDYITTDDVETVEESLRTHLADLSAHEARYLLLEGLYGPAGSMITAIADSGMDARVYTPALRPVRGVLRSELSELDGLWDTSAESGLVPISSYVQRLSVIKSRWVVLDPKGIVGLRDMVDEAAEKGYLHLRRTDNKDPKIDEILEHVGKIASAQSIREKVAAFGEELVESRKRLCHFCRVAPPDYDKCVVLKGKKETGRTTSGNTTTVHYSLQWALVYRCEPCAKLHDFIRKTSLALWLVGAPGVVAVFVTIFNML